MPNRKLLSFLILLTITLLACTSVSGIFGDPDPSDPGLNPKDLEDDNISADMTAQADYHPTVTPAPQTIIEPEETSNLTPEEALVAGTHHYSVEGEGQPLLGGDGTYSGEADVTFEFTDNGVIFYLEQNPPQEYRKESNNRYENVNENSDMFLIFTGYGFESHMPTIEWVYTYTLDE